MKWLWVGFLRLGKILFIFRVSGAYLMLSLILYKQPHGIWLCSPVLHLNPDYRHKVASREVDFLQWKVGPQNSGKTFSLFRK